MRKNVKKRQPTLSQLDRVFSDIRQLRVQNKSDSEIRALLGLELRTYQRYSKRIHDEDKEIWYSITAEQMATELLRLKSSFEDTYMKAKTLSENEKDVDAILDALDAKDNARMNIVLLLTEGPGMMEKVHQQGTYDYVNTTETTTEPDPGAPLVPSYPTITDPKWIADNMRKVMEQSNLK